MSIGEYRFSGTARNLQIRVELTYVGTSFGNLPNFSHPPPGRLEKTQRISDRTVAPESVRAAEVVTIKWQQKIMQPDPTLAQVVKVTETVQSSNDQGSNLIEEEQSPPPSDPRHINEEEEEENRPVHRQLRAPKPLPRVVTSTKSRIFTYVDSEIQQKVPPGTRSNQADETSTAFRPRKIAPLSTAAIRQPVREQPTAKQSEKQRSFIPMHQRMFIVAYLGAWSESYSADDEKVLCEVEVFGQRVLKMNPDQGVYNLDTRIGCYRYELTIEDYSDFDEIPPSIFFGDQEENDAITDEQFKFQLPDKQTIHLQYMITIEEAINFPFDGLYVEYEVDLPPNFRSLHKCSGRTQLCFTQAFGSKDVARFSFPFELSVIYRSEVMSEELFRWPRLLFRVLAEDQWQRFYVAGYGSTSLPTIPTVGQRVQIDCWRPFNPYSNLAKLREQFIGQAVDIQKGDSSSNSKMALIDLSKTFSKIGISAESSGTIVVSINCIRQSRHYITQELLRTLRYGRFITQIGLNSNLYYRITRVLVQFEETKRQLIRLRKQRLPAHRGSIIN